MRYAIANYDKHYADFCFEYVLEEGEEAIEMQGLRTQESSKFIKFFSTVQETAKEQKKVFFLDAGDGNGFSNDEMEGEDMLGWLIPESRAGEFAAEFENFSEGEEWDDFYVSVSCIMGDTLSVEFV